MTYKARSAQKGFTLIELAVVIAIIAILAAVAIPRFGNTAATAECSTIRDMVSQLNSAAAISTAENARTPANFAAFVTAGVLPAPGPGVATISLQNFGPNARATPCTVGATIACDTAFTNYNPTYSYASGVVTLDVAGTSIPKRVATAPDCR